MLARPAVPASVPAPTPPSPPVLNMAALQNRAHPNWAAEWGRLIGYYQPRLSRYLRQQSNVSADDLDDIVSLLWERAMRGMPRFRFQSQGQLEGWLMTIGNRAAIDLARRAESEWTRRALAMMKGAELHGNPEGVDRFVEERLAIASDRAIAEAALSPKEREFLRLKYDEDQHFGQIALALGYKNASVAASTWIRICSKLRRAWP